MTRLSLPRARETFGTPEQVHRRIINAAMECFSAYGPAAAGLRLVAKTAGVSVGLVQHHFHTKSELVDAVNEELLSIVRDAAPSASPPPDPVSDISHRLTTLIAKQPVAVNYLARVLAEDEPIGRRIFEMCFDIGKAQWDDLHGQGAVTPGMNATWATLNPLILVMGTLVLRPHIERQLPEPLASPTQLPIWEAALTQMVTSGQLRRDPAAAE